MNLELGEVFQAFCDKICAPLFLFLSLEKVCLLSFTGEVYSVNVFCQNIHKLVL